MVAAKAARPAPAHTGNEPREIDRHRRPICSHATRNPVTVQPTYTTPLIDIFHARCEARAHLVHWSEMDFCEAVDGLQDAAEQYGLIVSLGQDRIQTIIGDYFAGLGA